MLLKPDTLALRGTFWTLSGRPLGILIEAGGPGLRGRDTLRGLRQHLFALAQGFAVACEEEIRVEYRQIRPAGDGATIDTLPMVVAAPVF